MRRLLSVALLLAVCVAPAQELRNLPPTLRDFAWQWPLTINAGEDLVRLTLEPDVYARLWRDDVTDVVVFNGAGAPVPIAPLDARWEHAGASPTATTPIEVPGFRIPPNQTLNIGDRMRLVVSQRVDGRLQRLDAELGPTRAAPASSEWLVDLSAVHAPARGLLLEFEPDAAPLVARVDVFASSDLSDWTRIAAGQALVTLNQAGLTLERRRIEFAATQLPYLRLLRTDAQEALPIARVLVLRGSVSGESGPDFQRIELAGHPERQLGVFRYTNTGPFPIGRVAVILAERNAAASMILESRANAGLPWRERARGAVFRLAGKHGAIESAALDIATVRDRQWRVRTDPVQARAPLLILSYRPDQFAFLTQGEGPYRLAAGSARSQRVDAPLRALFDELHETQGEAWQWSEARLGRGAELAGGAALTPRPDASGSPTPWQWLLWGLLLAGAFTVLTMVLKLLRQSGA